MLPNQAIAKIDTSKNNHGIVGTMAGTAPTMP